MTKWISLLVLGALLSVSWFTFTKQGKEWDTLNEQITAVDEAGDPDETLAGLKDKRDSLESTKLFNGILLTFLSAGVAGIFFVVFLLPFFAQRVTHAVYDSGELVERDVMHDARSLLAQGEYEAAIAAFQEAAVADPLNRLPWVEIAKIQKDNLGDPAAAIETIRYALESQSWEVNDAAYFLFRLAELYDEVQGDRASATAIMHQVVEQFPGTRHAANANHKLHEWGNSDTNDVEKDVEKDLAAEEAEFLARMAQREAGEGASQSRA